MATEVKVGDKVLVQGTHLFEVWTATFPVVKVTAEKVVCRVPEKVKNMPFPPYTTKYVAFANDAKTAAATLTK